jgi:hydrogenase-4 component H
MKWPKLRELKEAVTSFVRGPYTHPFPAQPTPVPANIRGKPVYHPEKCIGCGACAEVCPARAIELLEVQMPDGRLVRRLVLHTDNCIFCAECVRCCTTKEGISLSAEYELSALSRDGMREVVEKEMVRCEICHRGIAPRDHLLWIAGRLKGVAVANQTVFLVEMEELGLRETALRDDRPMNRSDIQRVLCAKCRRGVTLQDAWGPF